MFWIPENHLISQSSKPRDFDHKHYTIYYVALYYYYLLPVYTTVLALVIVEEPPLQEDNSDLSLQVPA